MNILKELTQIEKDIKRFSLDNFKGMKIEEVSDEMEKEESENIFAKGFLFYLKKIKSKDEYALENFYNKIFNQKN